MVVSYQIHAMAQVGSYDCRHSLHTIAHLHEHKQVGASGDTKVEIYVVEDEPEVIARHMLLLALLVDPTWAPRQKLEMFLEIHGNALVTDTAAQVIGTKL